MDKDASRTGDLRAFYARLMAARSHAPDPRLEDAIAAVPREEFLPAGPWQIMTDHGYVDTPSADLAFIYQDVLVALDAEHGINNGSPFLHGAWLGAVQPRTGERVVHIGAGTGYYTAILSKLVGPKGTVCAFEIEDKLAALARNNLSAYANVSVSTADATHAQLGAADVVYVNAGVGSLPAAWLDALTPGGRMIFPWRPAAHIPLVLLVEAIAEGFSTRPLMRAWFIPCIGTQDAASSDLAPKSIQEAQNISSVWRRRDCEPDESCVAAGHEVWFSSTPLAKHS